MTLATASKVALSSQRETIPICASSKGSNIKKMETQDFDSTLWQHLPSELLENVLTRLPISTLLSFCQVCKQWKKLIQSTEFACRCGSTQPLAFFHYEGTAETAPYLAVPNTTTNTWEKHTLNFASGRVSVIAADQGLICFGSESVDTLFIYNPLTRLWKKLTIPEEGDDQFSRRCTPGTGKLVGLSVDRETGNYKLIVGFIKDQIVMYENPTRTLTYDSVSSTWTTIPVCPILPLEDEDEDEAPGDWEDLWIPGESVRSGDKLYWLVEKDMELTGSAFRLIVKFDVTAGTWTVDEPDLPYPPFVDYPGFLYVRPFYELPMPYGLGEGKPPPWNFHLASYDGVVYVMLSDSLVSKEAFSGEFSSLIPEVKIIDADFVCRVRELANPPDRYMPTKAVSLGEVWYFVFEYRGVWRKERGKRPLLVFAYSPRRNAWGWLPELGSNSSCRGVSPNCYPPHWLPEFFTCTLSLRAFV
ncbi:hypothetical protein R1sor_009728 [Riccia sorocarpa]|uniref:F-box domain-containing protein n=1 Tax=Riccia sorocarpa TaxID=122646 RepID=A0ABD3HZI8_9MARC